MSNCSHCNADLSRLTWPVDRCPHCGRLVASNATIEFPPSAGSSPPSSSSGDVRDPASATIDFPPPASLSPPSSSSGDVQDPASATIDFPPPADSSPPSASSGDVRDPANATIDFPPAGGASNTERFIPPTVTAPLDSTFDFSVGPGASSEAVGATVDLPPPGAKTDSPRGEATIDLSTPTQAAPSSSSANFGPPTSRKTDPLTSGMATMDAGGAGGAGVKGLGTQMDRVWRESIGSSDRPDMTYKAGGPSTNTVINVVIRPRRLQAPNVANTGTADYELVEVLGEGGVGIVFSARQASIDRSVALKMLKADMARDPGHRSKFLSEAVVTGDLDHPNIVPIYDLGSNDQGALFYSMKRVRGTPWSKVIGKKSQAENIEILMKVADAVAFAHARGVLHRDLKPENVMLGDYGEVLVMDWGIALSTPDYPKHGAITQTASMGGTPVYMAPEMASGPLEAITAASDVYLLGAILFEILCGKPPHGGKDVMACIYAAMRNEIRPTNKTGELVDIAYKAMATQPANRFPSVLAFQAAVREYQSHSESVALSTRAENELVAARQSREYHDFARVLFAFQEAAALWDGNQKAVEGIVEAQLAYAACALEKGDFELGISLLDRGHPDHAELLAQLVAAQRERDARQHRLKRLRRLALALVMLVFTVVTVAFFWIQEKNRQVVTANSQLEATNAELTSTTDQLRTSEGQLRNEKLALEENQKRLRQEKMRADDAAEDARLEARRAREAQQREAYATYLAQIGLSAERIASNAFVDADRLLRRYEKGEESRFRHWEWGHLRHLGRLDRETLSIGAYVESVARSGDGRRVAVGTSSGTAIVWQFDWAKMAAGETTADRKTMARVVHGAPIHAVALSHDGSLLATGGERPAAPGDGAAQTSEAEIKLWRLADDRQSYQLLRVVEGHLDGVLSLAFSADAARLASSSRDETARLWEVASGRQERAYRGHFGPVASVAFGPAISGQPQRLVTAGDDATVRVWTVDSDASPIVFRGHKQAVNAACFDPTGKLVASGGRDNELLIWEWDGLEDFDFRAVEARLKASAAGDDGDDVAPARHEPTWRLVGHSAEIRSIAFSGDGQRLLSAGNDNCVKRWRFRASPTDADFVETYRGHGGWVRSCVFASNERYCISGGRDMQLKIWDVDAYEEVRTLRGHEDAVLASVFSPSGEHAVTTGRDRQAILWNARTGQPLRRLEQQFAGESSSSATDAESRRPLATLKEGHEFLVTTAVFFPRGDRLVTSAGDNTARVWDVATGAQLRSLEGAGNVGAATVSADGKWLATGSDGNDAMIWRADAPQLPAVRLTGHESAITTVAFSKADSDKTSGAPTLYTGDALGRGRLWRRDGRTGQWSSYAKCSGHLAGFGVTAASFLPGDRQLLTASHDHAVFRWDVKTGERVTEQVLRHPEAVKSLDLSADGRSALTFCSLGKNAYRLYLWDWANGGERHLDPDVGGGIVTTATFDHDQRGAIVASTDGGESSLWRWTFATGEFKPLWPANTVRGTIWSVASSPDGQRLVAVGGSQARLLKSADGELEKSFRPHGAIAAAAYSPNGLLLATGGADGDVKIWNMAATAAEFGKVAFKIPHAHARDGLVYGVASVEFAPAHKGRSERLLTAGDDGMARLWELADADAEPRTVFAGHAARVRAATFSADGALVATASDDRTARLWDAATGRPFGPRVGGLPHPAGVASVAFSSDGRRLITGSDDNLARIWTIGELETSNEPTTTLAGHTAPVTAVSFSQDGRRALTSSQDGTARLWDADGGTEVLSLKRHAAEISSARFSPDGRSILTGSRDGTAIVWPAHTYESPAADGTR